MKNNYVYIIILIFIFANNLFADNRYEVTLDDLEKKVFGFVLDNDKSIEERIIALEKKSLGKSIKGNFENRLERLDNFIFKDGRGDSLESRVSNFELHIFSKIDRENDVITRLENIEFILKNRVENRLSFLERVEDLRVILNLSDDKWILREKVLNSLKSAWLEPTKIYSDLKLDEELQFVLEDESDIVEMLYAKVKKIYIKKKREIVELEFYLIETKSGEEITISRKVILEGKKGLFSRRRLKIESKIYMD